MERKENRKKKITCDVCLEKTKEFYEGKILRICPPCFEKFEREGECNYCEGTGKIYIGKILKFPITCYLCDGTGKKKN